MMLIGTWRTIPEPHAGEDAVAAFYAGLIPRLLTEVDRRPEQSRLVGFRAILDGGEFWQFLGVEVDRIEEVPDGLIGLTLGNALGEVIERCASKRFDIEWAWQDSTGPLAVGEFSAPFPFGTPDRLGFWMTANSYLAAEGAPAAEDAIDLVQYDPAWPGRFDEMARSLRALAPDLAERIVHYGSTSIPGMPAKPVIDMLVEVPSFDQARRRLIPAMNRQDCEYWWYADHMIFIKRDRPHGVRTHHVHIAPPGHRLWEGILFRDYLIAHPDAAREYAAVKFDLAARFRTEREKYTNAKGAFIRKITDKALAD